MSQVERQSILFCGRQWQTLSSVEGVLRLPASIKCKEAPARIFAALSNKGANSA
jgi:hypothetical protein